MFSGSYASKSSAYLYAVWRASQYRCVALKIPAGGRVFCFALNSTRNYRKHFADAVNCARPVPRPQPATTAAPWLSDIVRATEDTKHKSSNDVLSHSVDNIILRFNTINTTVLNSSITVTGTSFLLVEEEQPSPSIDTPRYTNLS